MPFTQRKGHSTSVSAHIKQCGRPPIIRAFFAVAATRITALLSLSCNVGLRPVARGICSPHAALWVGHACFWHPLLQYHTDRHRPHDWTGLIIWHVEQ